MKKSPPKPARPPQAQVPTPEPGGTLPVTLATAEIPTAEEQELIGDPRWFHRINVRPHGQHFRLWDWDEVCGDRLLKGHGTKQTPLRFSLKDTKIPVKAWEPRWITYATLGDAITAANLLQAYLDEEENPALARLRAKQKK